MTLREVAAAPEVRAGALHVGWLVLAAVACGLVAVVALAQFGGTSAVEAGAVFFAVAAVVLVAGRARRSRPPGLHAHD